MGEKGVLVWGKSGELLNYTSEKDATVEHIKFAALDELRERMLGESCDNGLEIDRRKLVLLDHLGNQPRGVDLVKSFKYLFIFVRPSREMPKEHPDGLPKDFFDEDLFMELSPLDLPKPNLESSANLSTSQRLLRFKEDMQSRTDRCKVYAQVARSRADFCNRSSTALQLQNKARDAVCAHIGQLFHKVLESYSDLNDRVEKGGKQFNDLLDNFEVDIQRLKNTPIHPSLQVDGRTSLYTCVNDIIPWKERCHEKWQGLTAKLAEFEDDLDKVKREVENVNNSLPIGVVDFEGLERARTESRDTALSLRALQEESESCLIGITDRMNMAGHTLDEALDMEQNRAWRDLITEQDKKERSMFEKLLTVEKACKLCAQQRQQIQLFMEQHVERAVNLTSEIIKLQRRVIAYSATLDGVKEYFHQLQIVRHLPGAYQWGLIELFRRIHYHRKVACVVSTAQQTLHKLREEEEEHRKAWGASLGPFMPEGILDNLAQPVLTVKIDTEPAVLDLTYPGFSKPYNTPEETRAFYMTRAISMAKDSPEPPESLVKLCSRDLEEELDALVEGRLVKVERRRKETEDEGVEDARSIEIRELRKRVEQLEGTVKQYQEGASDILAKCCTVEEAVREIPQMRTFTMEDPDEIQKLRDLGSKCIPWDVITPPGAEPSTWEGTFMLFTTTTTPPTPLIQHPHTDGYTLDPVVLQRAQSPLPEWVCVRVVIVAEDTKKVTGELIHPAVLKG